MKATLVEKKKVSVMCPNCGDEDSHDISSLEPNMTFGPSYCNSCGIGIRGYVGDTSVEISEAEYRRDTTVVLLRISPQDSPIYLIVSGADFTSQAGAASGSTQEEQDFLDSDEFFYNHNCDPAVVLRRVVAVIRAGVAHPEGVFEHVTTRRAPSPMAGEVNDEVPESVLKEFIPLTVQPSAGAAVAPNLNSNSSGNTT